MVTNFQVHKHPTSHQMSKGALSLETNAFWRFQTLTNRFTENNDLFTPNDLKANNDCVNISRLFEEMVTDPEFGSIAANVLARTLWHSLYNLQEGTAEFSFYLGENEHADGALIEKRSDYLKFFLEE